MKKTKALFIGFGILAAIIATLIYNKSRSEAKAKSDVLTSVPVSVVTLTRQQLSDTRTLTGTIAANNDVAILSETQGKVTKVFAEVGQYVSASSVLIQLDDEVKQATYAAAEASYQKAKKDYERFESLSKQNSATDSQLETALFAYKSAEAQYVLAKRQYNDTKIKTPISGIVTARNADVGTMVLDKMNVANVVDISKLKVKINVAERDAFRIHAGDNVDVTTDVYPGVSYAGKIHSISSKADESHTYPVEITLSNSKEHPLKAGMFGSVTFKSNGDQQSLTIPREALVGSAKKPQVYVVEGVVARLRDIVIGSEFGTQLSVINGLKENETVVSAGQNNLKDGASVTVVK